MLIDHDTALLSAWRSMFEHIDAVQAIEADYFSEEADAMVSPANSFGIMDGGLDLAIRDTLGFDIQQKVQNKILENHHGELPIGSAEIVETGHSRWPYLVVAPTMRVPESVANTTNAYSAFRAILLAIRTHNETVSDKPIRSLICSGLGTGIGGLSPARCALQMHMAFEQVKNPAKIPSIGAIHQSHQALRTS